MVCMSEAYSSPKYSFLLARITPQALPSWPLILKSPSSYLSGAEPEIRHPLGMRKEHKNIIMPMNSRLAGSLFFILKVTGNNVIFYGLAGLG